MRKFETDYAGAWRGFCKTREGAVIAAHKHLVRDGYKRCTITNRETGEVIARLSISDDKKTITTVAVKQFRKIGL